MSTKVRVELERELSAREWYHTLELAPGLVTPGWFDVRGVVPLIPFPASLEGKRCLDVGTFDGFWAFEMERRGATEVLATDVIDPRGWDWPVGSNEDVVAAIASRKGTGEGFDIARRALGSRVCRRELSIYDLDPDEVGRFDFVYVGSLLLHLRDPVRALERVRSVCAGTLLVCDAVNPSMTRLHPRRPMASLDGVGRPWWWKPNLAGLVRMVEAAGFSLEGPPIRLRMPPGDGQPRPCLRPRRLLRREGREEALSAWRGDHHAAVTARPTV